ncbi:MAG: hypothetical protein JWL80_547 [Parcubacteria group bacterium]|nr:hypothetical protein [Parcubacteria group bacterium]
MNYWLLKTEPTSYSIEDLQKEKKTTWTGVRNYQARNFLRDMKKGDKVFVYHSSCEIPGLFGVGEVVTDALPDPTAFDKKDSHFEPKSTKENPIWFAPTISFGKKFSEPLTLFQIKADAELKNMMVAQQGSRLSVMPVEKEHFQKIMKTLG